MLAKNNPFNIRTGSSRWIGLSGSHQGFCVFHTLEFGVRAACVLLMSSYRKKGIVTIDDIIKRFAPPSENNTNSYISYICGCTGFSRSQIISTCYQYAKILSSMAWFETHTSLRVSYVLQVIEMFKISVYEKAENN